MKLKKIKKLVCDHVLEAYDEISYRLYQSTGHHKWNEEFVNIPFTWIHPAFFANDMIDALTQQIDEEICQGLSVEDTPQLISARFPALIIPVYKTLILPPSRDIITEVSLDEYHRHLVWANSRS